MKRLLKNKFVLITAVVLVLVVIVGSVFLFFPKSSQNQTDQSVAALPTQVPIPTIAPDSIGLTLKNGVPGETVIATVAKIDGIKSIDFEFYYNAQNPTDSTARIPREVLGSFNLSKIPVTTEIKLGTCSDVCHYDKDVTDIKIVLKITRSDDKVYQSQATLASVSE